MTNDKINTSSIFGSGDSKENSDNLSLQEASEILLTDVERMKQKLEIYSNTKPRGRREIEEVEKAADLLEDVKRMEEKIRILSSGSDAKRMRDKLAIFSTDPLTKANAKVAKEESDIEARIDRQRMQEKVDVLASNDTSKSSTKSGVRTAMEKIEAQEAEMIAKAGKGQQLPKDFNPIDAMKASMEIAENPEKAAEAEAKQLEAYNKAKAERDSKRAEMKRKFDMYGGE